MRKEKVLLKLLSNPHLLKTLYSPRISRTIPARAHPYVGVLLTEWTVVGITTMIFLFMIISLSLTINGQIQELAKRQAVHSSLVGEMHYWEEIVTKYPQYRDGYFHLALLQYQAGEVHLAGASLEKVLTIDPTFAPGIAFQQKLLGNE